MFVFEGFLAGVASVLSFGWVKKGHSPLRSVPKIVADDWYLIGGDMYSAIAKYRTMEKENDKT